MNQFLVKLGENSFYRKLMKEPLTYVTGAILLAVFQIAHVAIFQGGWGVTSSFANWGAWVYEMLGGNVTDWGYFSGQEAQATMAGGFLNDGASLRNVGIVLGALVATLYASEFKIKKIKSVRQIIAAVLGGLLMGYGARLASGCNIGALFTGVASFSLSGWVFAAFLIVGAFIGSKLLAKFFM